MSESYRKVLMDLIQDYAHDIDIGANFRVADAIISETLKRLPKEKKKTKYGTWGSLMQPHEAYSHAIQDMKKAIGG